MRNKALKWWNELNPLDQLQLTKLIIDEKRSFRSLTDIEIIKIYKWNGSI